MNQHDIIRAMGRFPDKINPPQRLTSEVWTCTTCGALHESATPVTNPAPCHECEGISFITGRSKA